MHNRGDGCVLVISGRLNNWVNRTRSELVWIQTPLVYFAKNSYHRLVLPDSKAIQMSLYCLEPVCYVTINHIQSLLNTSKYKKLDIPLSWIPFHIVFSQDNIEKMAKQVCLETDTDLNLSVTNNAAKSILIRGAFEDLLQGCPTYNHKGTTSYLRQASAGRKT